MKQSQHRQVQENSLFGLCQCPIKQRQTKTVSNMIYFLKISVLLCMHNLTVLMRPVRLILIQSALAWKIPSRLT